MAEGDEGRDYGKICVFCSRLCGVFSAMSEWHSEVETQWCLLYTLFLIYNYAVFLLCGFGALIPSPSIAPGASYGRCLATGLLMM